MKEAKSIAKNYSEALHELTKNDLNSQQIILQELNSLITSINQINGAWKLFENPSISKEEKKKIVETLKQKLSQTTTNFLYLLIDKGRFNLLADIQKELVKLINRASGTVVAEVYSASQIDVNTLDSLRSTLEASLGHNERVTLESKIEPALIGGLKVKINDLVYDGSVKERLENLKRRIQA